MTVMCVMKIVVIRIPLCNQVVFLNGILIGLQPLKSQRTVGRIPT